MTITHHPILSFCPILRGVSRRPWWGLLGGILLLLCTGLSLPDQVLAQSASLSAGGYHTCALGADGTISCWGNDYYDQTIVPTGLVAAAVSAGRNYTCALKADGTISCWGNNDFDQTDIPGGLGPAMAVTTGDFHTCALGADGTVTCWGQDNNGQTTGVPDDLVATAVSLGLHHTCALEAAGTVSCWGDEYFEQTWVPDGLGPATAVSAGESHTCALGADGTVTCWGHDQFGQTTVPNEIKDKLDPSFMGAMAVSAGGRHTCALRVDGTVICWGDNREGQTDDGPAGLVATAISAGESHTCALEVGGGVICWGYNGSGQTNVPGDLVVTLDAITVTPENPTIAVGATQAMTATGTFSDGNTADLMSSLPLRATALSAAGGHTCALGADGTASCWGLNDGGQINVPDELGPVKAISAGGFHSCVLKADGTVSCWGANADGQLEVPNELGPVKAISAGAFHTCALKTDGPVTCWGRNGDGQTDVPITLGPAIAVSAGTFSTCAMEADGMVICWGLNDEGQTDVPNELGPFRAISASVSNAYYCALGPDGSVTCWGNNNYDQTDVPLNLGPVTAIGAGGAHSCALKADGTVSCWGANFNNQLNVPAGLGPVRALSAAAGHSCALTVDGTVSCWGFNLYGSLDIPVSRPTWESSDLVVATIDETGLATGMAVGTTTLSANLFGVSGQISLTVEDPTPPEITPLVTGTHGTDVSIGQTFGWYTSDVTVTWEVSDPESTITEQLGCNETIISADTDAAGVTVTCTAQSAGGARSVTVTILKDSTLATVSLLTPPDGATYVVTQPVVAEWSVSDASPGSGVSTSTGTVPSGQLIDTTTVGDQTFTVEVTDGAGLMTTVTHQYTVVTPVEALATFVGHVQSLGLPHGLTNSLVKKLENASQDLDNDDPARAAGKLQSFIKAVNRQTGKKIAPDDAAALIAQAQIILAAIIP